MINFLPYWSDLLSGLSITFILMLASVSIGLSLAITMTMASLSEVKLLRQLVSLVIYFIRGTPLLVQLFLIYYGVGQFAFIRDSIFWDILQSPMACAIIALSLNTACYTSVLLTGAVHSVPKSEVAACDALGMSKWLAFRRVVFPRAFRIALPAYSNEVIIVLKCTSLASTITLLDLMGVTQHLIGETYQTVQWYLIAGTIYLLMNGIIMIIFNRLLKWSAIPHNK